MQMKNMAYLTTLSDSGTEEMSTGTLLGKKNW